MEPSKPQRIPLETRNSPPSPPVVAEPEPAEPAQPTQPLSADQIDSLRQDVIGVLKTCYDPEVPVNIYELGLIYGIDINPSGGVHIRMTLTSPACPVAGSLPPEVERKVKALPGVTRAKVDVVWDPPWSTERMTEAARLQLGID